jgi:hypothetical protein
MRRMHTDGEMPVPVVFAGPSLRSADRTLLEADYRPPAQLGCILRAVRDGAQVVGLIDGYFERVPAVFHKEILWAMARGVVVYGAASMGALRAAELAPYGMRGIGAIFAMFRSGQLEDDDEVAVLHDPPQSGYRPRSVALVDLRATVARAQTASIVDDDTAALIVASAKALFYPERTYRAAVDRARANGARSGALSRFSTWVACHPYSQKAEDAAELLRMIAALPSTPAARSSLGFEPTDYWEQIRPDEEDYVPAPPD